MPNQFYKPKEERIESNVTPSDNVSKKHLNFPDLPARFKETIKEYQGKPEIILKTPSQIEIGK
jgi:hypothetical protein